MLFYTPFLTWNFYVYKTVAFFSIFLNISVLQNTVDFHYFLVSEDVTVCL